MLANYSQSGLNYEMIQNLPEIYKNLNMGNVTLFQSDSENSIPALEYVASSLLNFAMAGKEKKVEN